MESVLECKEGYGRSDVYVMFRPFEWLMWSLREKVVRVDGWKQHVTVWEGQTSHNIIIKKSSS